MRVCLVGKYPPLQGGTSVQAFWLVHELAEQGCQVSVVTATAAAAPGETCFFRSDEWSTLARHFPAVARVALTEIGAEGFEGRSIPHTDALVTRLAAAALDAIDAHGSEVVIASYLEPYAVSAHLAATARQLPLAVIHAGSDLNRLARLGTRRSLYEQVLRSAEVVITTRGSARRLARLRGSNSGLIHQRPILSPRSLFGEPAPPLQLEHVRAGLSHGPWAPLMSGSGTLRGPVIGMYGKSGAAKGTGELLAAAAELREQGLEFSALLMTGSGPLGHESLRDEIGRLGLAETVTVIPFLPPWRVPEFLATCDCVCFLEHDFEIAEHQPQVPREIAVAGRCLIISAQAAASEPAELIDGENALIVADPADGGSLVAVLRRALDDPELRDRVASAAPAAYGWTTEAERTRWAQRLISLLADASAMKQGQKMSLTAFQDTLMRIYADPAYRSELLGEPSRLEDDTELELEPGEIASLEALLGDRVALERYCRGLVDKRLHHLEAQFAEVLGVYPEVLERLRAEFRASWVLRDVEPATELRAFEELLLRAGAQVLGAGAEDRFAPWVRYSGMCMRVATSSVNGAHQGVAPEGEDPLVSRGVDSELGLYQGKLVDASWALSSEEWRVGAVRHPERLEARVFDLTPPVFAVLSDLAEPIRLSTFATRLAGVDASAETLEAARVAARRLLDVGLLQAVPS